MHCYRHRLSRTEGLEPLRSLKVLDLSNNLLAGYASIRALSLNIALVQLVLAGNPVTQLSNYRTTVLNVVRDASTYQSHLSQSISLAPVVRHPVVRSS